MAYNINDLMKKDGKVERNIKPEEIKETKEEPKKYTPKTLSSFFTDSEKIGNKLLKNVKKECEPKEGIDLMIENIKKVFTLILTLLLQITIIGAIMGLIIKFLTFIFSL